MNYGFEKSKKGQGYSYTYKGTRLFSLKKISAPDDIYDYTEKIKYGKNIMNLLFVVKDNIIKITPIM